MNWQRRIFSILAVSAGNLVEWLDFYASSFCSIYFAAAFLLVGNFIPHLLKQQVFSQQAFHG